MSKSVHQWNAEMASLVEKVRRSLVQILNGCDGSGAGVLLHPDGPILTNAHVARRRKLKVTLPAGTALPARLLASSLELDLAALSVDAHGLPSMQIGYPTRLQPGHWVLAVGHPWGVTGAVTAGIITGMGKQLPEMPFSAREWIAVNLHPRPGYSGSPLVDAQGLMVGLNTIMADPDVGLAVPGHEIKSFLRQALNS
jgi:serine protease Do